MVLELAQQPAISAGDVETIAIDYIDQLDTGELLTGTPTIAEVTTTDLTLSNKAVSTGTLTILGRTVSPGKAVQCTVSGQQAGTTYTIRVTVSTDATTPRTFVRDIKLACVS